MPRVKIDYVVSFSSEDTDNQASNLLAWEVSKKKWLCSKGEPSCSVVLQLVRAVKISAIHIGAHHAAFVEVLVGRSEKPNDQFQVLVPKSVFLSPAESRREPPAERVRSFAGEQLAPARAQRWDRVRVVCDQPHNKHCKYGLSFVHIYEPEGSASAAPPAAVTSASALPARVLALDTFSSDEDEFKPGELFAKHLQKPTDTQPGSSTGDTGAQIRQATSQALKNISDSATKLMKTPISKTASKKPNNTNEVPADRRRDDLVYSRADALPHARIDRVVQRHHEQKNKEEPNKRPDNKEKLITSRYSKEDRTDLKKDKDPAQESHSKNNQTSVKIEHRTGDDSSTRVAGTSKNSDHTVNGQRAENERRKRPRSDNESKKKGGERTEPHELLQDVVLVLSGYENPRRGAVRSAALAMGARVLRDWGPACTHLICAFPNTPKLRQVRASPGGGAVPVARAEWLEQCSRRRRRLPWQWFATEPRHQLPPHYSDCEDEAGEDRGGGGDPDCDTDEEIDKVLRTQKKHRGDASPDPPAARRASPKREPKSPDVQPELDNQQLSRKSSTKPSRYSIDTIIDGNDSPTINESLKIDTELASALPDFFDGYTFVIDEEAIDERFDAQLLRRYIRAYGGVVLEASQIDEDSSVNYVVCTEASAMAARRVAPGWLWRCHAAARLLPPDEPRSPHLT